MARGVPRLPAVVMFSSNSTSRVPNTFAVYIVARSSRFLLFGHPLRVLSGRSVDVFDQSFSRAQILGKTPFKHPLLGKSYSYRGYRGPHVIYLRVGAHAPCAFMVA